MDRPATKTVVHLQCEEQGIRYEQAEYDSDEETWDDVLEELEDAWEREPKVSNTLGVECCPVL